jgi:hypothetical protein
LAGLNSQTVNSITSPNHHNVEPVDFNEEFSAFRGDTLADQAEYANACIKFIRSQYVESVQDKKQKPPPVLLFGHSMGGIIARAIFLLPDFEPESVLLIASLSTPHVAPVVAADLRLVEMYQRVNRLWRVAHGIALDSLQAEETYSPQLLKDVSTLPVISIAGGSRDTLVSSELSSLAGLVNPSLYLFVFSSGMPTAWTVTDHQSILWCNQVVKSLQGAISALAERGFARVKRSRVIPVFHRFLVGAHSEVPVSRPPASVVAIPDSFVWKSTDQHSVLPLSANGSANPVLGLDFISSAKGSFKVAKKRGQCDGLVAPEHQQTSRPHYVQILLAPTVHTEPVAAMICSSGSLNTSLFGCTRDTEDAPALSHLVIPKPHSKDPSFERSGYASFVTAYHFIQARLESGQVLYLRSQGSSPQSSEFGFGVVMQEAPYTKVDCSHFGQFIFFYEYFCHERMICFFFSYQ